MNYFFSFKNLVVAVVILTGFFTFEICGQKNKDVGERVKKAFEAARSGNYTLLSDLDGIGEEIIPFVEPYILDKDDLISRESLNIISKFNERKSLPLLAKGLSDQRLFGYVSELIYENYKPSQIAGSAQLRAALLKSVETDKVSSAGILLLGNFHGSDIEQSLERIEKTHGGETGRVSGNLPKVSYAIAANLMLLHLQNADAPKKILLLIKDAQPDEMFFILRFLDSINDKLLLRQVKNIALSDKRTIPFTQAERVVKMPDGVIKYVTFQQRVCDTAVDVLIEKFSLRVSFKRQNKPYSPTLIAEISKKVDTALTSNPSKKLPK